MGSDDVDEDETGILGKGEARQGRMVGRRGIVYVRWRRKIFFERGSSGR